jgi:hypothetical protein
MVTCNRPDYFLFYFNILSVFVETMPIVIVLSLALSFVRGQLGLYPFQGRHRVAHIFPYLFYTFLLSITGLGLFLAPAPAWYPTEHPQWIAVPFIAYVLAQRMRGFHFAHQGMTATPTVKRIARGHHVGRGLSRSL